MAVTNNNAPSSTQVRVDAGAPGSVAFEIGAQQLGLVGAGLPPIPQSFTPMHTT